MIAGGIPRFHLVKPIENVALFVRGDAEPGIGDRDLDQVRVLGSFAGTYDNFPSGRSMPDRVVQEIGQHLGNPIFVERDLGQTGGDLVQQYDLPGRRDRSHRSNRPLHERAQGSSFQADRQLAGFEASGIKQVIDTKP